MLHFYLLEMIFLVSKPKTYLKLLISKNFFKIFNDRKHFIELYTVEKYEKLEYLHDKSERGLKYYYHIFYNLSGGLITSNVIILREYSNVVIYYVKFNRIHNCNDYVKCNKNPKCFVTIDRISNRNISVAILPKCYYFNKLIDNEIDFLITKTHLFNNTSLEMIKNIESQKNNGSPYLVDIKKKEIKYF